MLGLSWTLSPSVATRFAHGHRFIPVERPTIVSARVHRDNVFAAFVDRKEDEIILDPEKLWDLETRAR